jgi:hypothetical protein
MEEKEVNNRWSQYGLRTVTDLCLVSRLACATHLLNLVETQFLLHQMLQGPSVVHPHWRVLFQSKHREWFNPMVNDESDVAYFVNGIHDDARLFVEAVEESLVGNWEKSEQHVRVDSLEQTCLQGTQFCWHRLFYHCRIPAQCHNERQLAFRMLDDFGPESFQLSHICLLFYFDIGLKKLHGWRGFLAIFREGFLMTHHCAALGPCAAPSFHVSFLS